MMSQPTEAGTQIKDWVVVDWEERGRGYKAGSREDIMLRRKEGRKRENNKVHKNYRILARSLCFI